MRKVKITEQGRLKIADSADYVICPYATHPNSISLCNTSCALFRLSSWLKIGNGEYLNQADIKVRFAYCGDKLIGELAGDAK